jgi:glycosyltransferase involved in cell wall biosynthesis
MGDTVVVVPCFNEEERLDREAFARYAREGRAKLLFVNDGSSDGTEQVLRELTGASDGRAGLLSLEQNAGKAEAVRQGMLRALDEGAAVVGYLDADLSTPLEEADRLEDRLRVGGGQVVLAARVALLGRMIERKAVRHYLGRVFATFASMILDLPVYDTQCGAKFFRASPTLRHALDEPFLSRWAFDVELIGRLLTGGPGAPPLSIEDFEEVPLYEWRDVEGSKLRTGHMVGVLGDLARIQADLRRRERAARG